jgi:hypothetical protein
VPQHRLEGSKRILHRWIPTGCHSLCASETLCRNVLNEAVRCCLCCWVTLHVAWLLLLSCLSRWML